MMTAERAECVVEEGAGCCIPVHSTFGAGLLETAYTACFVHELRKTGLDIKTEVSVPVVYDGLKLADVGFRMDILVENELVVEVKSLETIAPVHLSQLTSYLKLADRRLGLLINFNVESLRDGIYRRVNKF
jgi:GxxExxY protein